MAPDGFGNPFRVGCKARDNAAAVVLFRALAREPEQAEWRTTVRRELGQAIALACWCRADQPCHVDALLELIQEA